MNDNNNSQSVPGDAQLTSAEGGENVGSTGTLSLADLNSLLGRNFTDVEAAKKALKDTQDFVGRRKEDIARELQTAQATTTTAQSTTTSQPANVASKEELNEVKTRLFFSENPQYKGYESLIKRMGGDPAEVVQTPEFQAVFEKVKVADEVAQKKSIVSSSPRLAATKSATEEAVKVANATRSTQSTADVLATAIRQELEGE